MTPPRVVLFSRDLRVHDQPALAAASAAGGAVVPLFVVDPRLPANPNRLAFLGQCLADLRDSLRQRGGDLLVRRGDPVAEALRVATATGASGIEASADVSAYAATRQRRLTEACHRARLELRLHPGVTLAPPGALRPAGGDHYRVFTPYWRVWQRQHWRDELPAPGHLPLPTGLSTTDPAEVLRPPAGTAPAAVAGGESAARRRLAAWTERADRYADLRDDLAAGHTSRLSQDLHFGCLSPRAVAGACSEHPAYLRQLAWRDFYHQVLAAFPGLPRHAYRRGAIERWRDDDEALAAWRSGHTGVPVVDAGMRQLLAEGFIHNRARLITAGYLTRVLGQDWRSGAAWYAQHLLDADVANNNGNWQWVAGTGTGSSGRRGFNPIRQAHRFDPHGDYVRRWVPELAGVPGRSVHEPWRLPPGAAPRPPYPAPRVLTPGRT